MHDVVLRVQHLRDDDDAVLTQGRADSVGHRVDAAEQEVAVSVLLALADALNIPHDVVERLIDGGHLSPSSIARASSRVRTPRASIDSISASAPPSSWSGLCGTHRTDGAPSVGSTVTPGIGVPFFAASVTDLRPAADNPITDSSKLSTAHSNAAASSVMSTVTDLRPFATCNEPISRPSSSKM